MFVLQFLCMLSNHNLWVSLNKLLPNTSMAMLKADDCERALRARVSEEVGKCKAIEALKEAQGTKNPALFPL